MTSKQVQWREMARKTKYLIWEEENKLFKFVYLFVFFAISASRNKQQICYSALAEKSETSKKKQTKNCCTEAITHSFAITIGFQQIMKYQRLLLKSDWMEMHQAREKKPTTHTCIAPAHDDSNKYRKIKSTMSKTIRTPFQNCIYNNG